MTDRITLRIGSLAEPIEKRIKKTGETHSEYIRRLIAEDLGRKVPELKPGNPNFGAKKD